MRAVSRIVLALVIGAAGPVDGQQRPPTLYPGSVLRITVANNPSAPIIGPLFRSDEHGIVLRQHGDTVRVAWPDVARLEIRRSVSRRRTGTLLGAVSGFAVGAAVGLAAGGSCEEDRWFGENRCRIMLSAGLGGLGAITGAIIGSTIGSRPGLRWEEVQVRPLEVAVTPAARGIAVSAIVRF